MTTAAASAIRPLGRAGRAATWILLVVLLSVAGAGLAVTLDHAQTDALRPELTQRDDSVLAPRLEAVAQPLADLATASTALQDAGTNVLLDAQSQQIDKAKQDLAAGDAAVSTIQQAVQMLTTARAGLTQDVDVNHVSGANQGRVADLDAAIAAGGALPAYWQILADAAPLPISAVDALAAHDAAVVAATDAARGADYALALSHLADAKTELDRAGSLRDQAATNGMDVSTLSGQLDRLATYDAALTRLYTLLHTSGGVVTADAAAALKDVQAAQTALPKDTSSIVIIVSDLGGQTMTSALIAMDQARQPIVKAGGQ